MVTVEQMRKHQNNTEVIISEQMLIFLFLYSPVYLICYEMFNVENL